MNTLAELIEHHKARAENERRALTYAHLRGFSATAAKAKQSVDKHLAAVATLERAVADIERLQK